ncbi:outer membrane lipid asymmetry maintenance protein MlaD [Roseomonas sp. E05]|uniref:outer membrane lipid asymmetry maintenance protein MlaD n=1 Tax=Roseomonas sp. E05 TaxID=3046310 RepID=UPI0024B931A8|nr:outer membrane lipid asymmetry maintenance protein MlaD [Roseomonas sp. E05]MDJ0387922.1 outer membrane lipid asymmetry maintenance protein MlaD [Roseomonas sp. E05]
MQQRNWAEIATGALILLVAAAFLIFAVGQSGRSLSTNGGMTLTARFDRIDGLAPGADVRIGGVKVGTVVEQRLDPKTYLAVLRLSLQPGIDLPTDSSAEITSESLLGGKYVALVPGGAADMLQDGGAITITQSSVSLEALLGRFIFSVTQMNSGNSSQQGESEGAPAASAPR